MIASGDGKTIQWEADYFPFGAQRTVITNLADNPYQFTGYEYDSSTGYNYALARFDAGRWGRFLSPDPYLGSMDITNPQSLNRYAYVLNNPLNLIDPLGLACVVTDNGDGTESYFDDDSPGQTCEEAFADDGGGVTVNADWSDLPDWSGGTGGHGVSGGGPIISAGPPLPWYKNSCITSALGDAALHVGIDAIGLIPEAGGLARVIGHQAGYVGVVADQLGAKVIHGVGGSTSSVSGLAGLTDTSPTGLLSTGLTIAGFIPGLGQVSAAGSLIVDIYNAGKAIGQCR